jgi:hypothetical protein
MNNFTEIKTGGWDDEDPLDGDQVSLFQDNMLKTPNFSEGSEHTPTDTIHVLGSKGMHIETLETDFLEVGTTIITGGLNGTISGRLVPTIRTISSWPGDNVQHSMSQGNVVRALVGAASVVLDLRNTDAIEGDWVRVTMAIEGTLTIHGNGTTLGVTIAEGAQKTFTYFTTGGWALA